MAREWLRSFEARTERPDLEEEFIKALASASDLRVEVPLYRGKFLKEPPASLDDLGPPSPESARPGRYNESGTPVLYLSSSVSGVCRELDFPRPEHTLWLLRFRVPPDLRLLDARPPESSSDTEHSLVAAVFWVIESSRSPRGVFPRLGHRIAALVAARYDGMAVPGVRGDPADLYWNAVIFGPQPRWRQFADGIAQRMEAP